MADPFTIRIFVPDGDPESVRIIDRMNWTGTGISFPRRKWEAIKGRPEFERAGVYILSGYSDEDDMITVYVGRAEAINSRIDAHIKEKEFWDRAIIFVSNSGALNQAHAMWLEYMLITRAREARRCKLDNGNLPSEPFLSEAEKDDTAFFFGQILQILPLVELRAFEFARPVASPQTVSLVTNRVQDRDELDTIIVPARPEGFESAFIREKAWWAIRIAGGKIPKIKYIAAYQVQPISAVTHYAPVKQIEPFGEEGKYKIIFSSAATKLATPLKFDLPQGSMQAPRYTNIQKLINSKTMIDLF